MIVSDILNEVDNVWVPNSLTPDIKVAWLDQFQKELYRKLDYPNSTYAWATVMNTGRYTLPASVVVDRIRKVVYVDSDGEETEYEYTDYMIGTQTGDKYTIEEDTYLRVYPVPTALGGQLVRVTMTNNGSAYTSAPTVALSGGGGTGATCTAALSGATVDAVGVGAGGRSYTSAPTVTLSGGGGSGATAIATVGALIKVYHASPPTTLSASDLTVSPWGPADYHHYYVKRLAEEVAKSANVRDLALANNFKGDADGVKADMTGQFSAKPVRAFRPKMRW